MFAKKWSILAAALVIGSTLLAACAAPEPEMVTVEVTKIVEGETITEIVEVTAEPPPPEKEMRENVLDWVLSYDDIPTLDPSLGTDTSSIQVIEEITVGLTRLDDDANLLPGMSQTWDISDDGLTYVFHLLEDVPWVRWNGVGVERVLDEEGNVRLVTAHDFEYGLKRTCNPETASDYAYVVGFAVEGCDALLSAEGFGDMSDEEKQALIDGVAATSLDYYTLEVTFTNPAVYNINIIGLWVARAEPQWLIEEKGDRWSEPGFNQSYGPYALKEWVHDSFATIIKNPWWPGIPSAPVPQIDEIRFHFLMDTPALAEYEAGTLESSPAPLSDLDRIGGTHHRERRLHLLLRLQLEQAAGRQCPHAPRPLARH
jgi:oligopeptide transport system substrate-binding protein